MFFQTFKEHCTESFHPAASALTLLMFCKASFILSGWTADRTKMRVTTSTLPSGTFSLRSSLVKSHWKAQQRLEQYRGFCCHQKENNNTVVLNVILILLLNVFYVFIFHAKEDFNYHASYFHFTWKLRCKIAVFHCSEQI